MLFGQAQQQVVAEPDGERQRGIILRPRQHGWPGIERQIAE
jgi:hypothetical protein